MRSLLLGDSPPHLDLVFAPDLRRRLERDFGLDPQPRSAADLRAAAPGAFADVELLFSTWGMPALPEEEIRRLFPRLRALFYAAGSVQAFARPFLAAGVRVFGAWRANAIPVAQFVVSLALLANKGFFPAVRLASGRGADPAAAARAAAAHPGNAPGVAVGLIGLGAVGSLVAEALRGHGLDVLACDPLLDEARAASLGVRRATLEDLFALSQVVSNHLPDHPATRGTLGAALFRRMRPNATFLNTGRGAQVVEADLAAVLSERPDLTAILDVTHPEPPAPDHPFRALPNCLLTPHIAGSAGLEPRRMAEWMAEEAARLLRGDPPRHEIAADALPALA